LTKIIIKNKGYNSRDKANKNKYYPIDFFGFKEIPPSINKVRNPTGNKIKNNLINFIINFNNFLTYIINPLQLSI